MSDPHKPTLSIVPSITPETSKSNPPPISTKIAKSLDALAAMNNKEELTTLITIFMSTDGSIQVNCSTEEGTFKTIGVVEVGTTLLKDVLLGEITHE